MEKIDMFYNSEAELLIKSEYGRHVQNLVNHAKTIEDQEFRQKFVERIVNLMYQMNPRSKNIAEYKDSIWQDVFKIAGFDLEGVLPPNGQVPTQEEAQLRPDRLDYPKGEKRFRHYGHYVQEMIKKAISMEDEEKKTIYTSYIASYMKLAYRTWNREHFVNDNVIKEDLLTLSDGKLIIEENVLIENLVNPNQQRRRPNNNNYRNNNNRNNNHRNRKGNNKYRRRK